MTDIEQLLREAAMAAGYKPIRMSDDGRGLLLKGVQEPWNSLENSGDALDLASDLRMSIEMDPDSVTAGADESWATVCLHDLPAPTAITAATRLAITRAAAEMAAP